MESTTDNKKVAATLKMMTQRICHRCSLSPLFLVVCAGIARGQILLYTLEKSRESQDDVSVLSYIINKFVYIYVIVV